MPDLALLAALLSPLIKLYAAAESAWQKPGFGSDELKCLEALAAGLAKLHGTLNESRARTLQVSTVNAAFLRAYAGLFVDERRYLESRRTELTDILANVTQVELSLTDEPRTQLELMDGMLAGGLRTPQYGRLWAAFTQGESPLLSLAGTTKAEFEERFELAYAGLISGSSAEALLEEFARWSGHRERLIRRLLALDTHSWFARHIFGNVREHPDFEPMSLRDMYVEPACRWQRGHDSDEANLQTWIGEALGSPSTDLLLVSADFGRGKSLSARWLAASCARSYLQGAAPTVQTWFPIYVRASVDLFSASDVELVIARALRRQANDELGLKLGLSAKDPALTRPSGKALVIIDGFDEVRLTTNEKLELFSALHELSERDLRFVIFGRPESFAFLSKPASFRFGARSAELLDFDDARARDWLERWNRSGHAGARIDWSELSNKSYGELARTPVLLFMIAYTLSRAGNSNIDKVTDLYESFARAMARGKFDKCERHSVIEPAAHELARALRDRLQLMPTGKREEDEVEAMLWLMSRLAWETHKSDRPIKRHHIAHMLDKELGFDEAQLELVLVGGLLAMQADLQSGQKLFFFGHSSFFEYFVARWWWIQILELARFASDRQACREIEGARLAGAPLLSLPNSVPFLRERLRQLEPAEGRRVLKWAQACFTDLDVLRLPPTREPRYDVQAVALWIACELSSGFDLAAAGGREPLRCLLAAMFARAETTAPLRVPGMSAPGEQLGHAQLVRGHLDDCNLERVDLRGAHMQYASLARSNLREAELSLADLREANLSGAVLENANLAGANLARACLRDANLSGARLNGANLRGADLRGARLDRAHLRSANLARADLDHADLQGAELAGIALEQATNLETALFDGATLLDPQRSGAVRNEARMTTTLRAPAPFTAWADPPAEPQPALQATRSRAPQ